MKILVVASTMDLRHKLGCTPSWWQLWKALHEAGHEVIVTPYLGEPIEALWWRTYPNPCQAESLLFNRYLSARRDRGESPSRATVLTPLFRRLIKHHVRPRWRRHMQSILRTEGDVDVVLFMNVPLSHIYGIPREIMKPLGIPTVFYDGDMPSVLPEHAVERGLRFSYYDQIDLSEFDLFLANSEGVLPRLRALGATKVFPFHYAVDPDLFAPTNGPKVADVSYYALSDRAREEWMTKLISIPSRRLAKRRFRVAGGPFSIDIGRASYSGEVDYSAFRQFCCSSSINLNITSRTHATAPGTSTSRPFELAALGSCIVSQPYDGIEKWFDPEKEIIIVHDEQEACERYEQLLEEPSLANELSRRARNRVLKEHSYRRRAEELVTLIRSET
jgi:glycosyltransferase involved in cell wall biosynthesis